MKCLRCGYCCLQYDVMILVDPDLGQVEGNVVHKPTGERCRHLSGSAPGDYSCTIHNHPAYQGTPCSEFTQVGKPDADCRMGAYILKNLLTE